MFATHNAPPAYWSLIRTVKGTASFIGPNLRAGSHRGNIRPSEIRRRDKRVPVLGRCIRLMDQDEADELDAVNGGSSSFGMLSDAFNNVVNSIGDA
jgi:hypothetical protein